MQLNEESTEYILDKKHDKMFKEILQNEREMRKFIKGFVLYDFNDELELQNGEYITKFGKGKLVDILYKVKEKDIYFLIEHQTKIDYNMPFRMLEYSVEISRRAMKNINKLYASYRYPLILPIVIYTGNRKWTVSTKYSDEVIKIAGNLIRGIDIEYKVIDINEFGINELLQKNTKLTKAIVLEKCKNPDELFESFNRIVRNSTNKKELEEVKELLKYLLDKIEVNDLRKILENIEEKEENDMSTIQERVRDWANEFVNKYDEKLAKAEAKACEAEAKLKEQEANFKKQEVEVRRETLKDVIIRMLKIQLTDDTIEQLTGANKEEINRVRDELISQLM